MSIVNFSPDRQYLHSPITIIHNIQVKYKVVFTLLYLFLIPFIPAITIVLILQYLFMFYNLFKYLKLKSKYNNKILKILNIYTILLITIFIISNKIKYKTDKYIRIIFPHIITNYKFFTIQFKVYFLPYFLINTVVFIYNSIHCLSILFLTTKLENITLLFLNLIYYLIHSRDVFKILFIFSCALSIQFLYIILNQIKNHNYSQKIRKIDKLSQTYYIYLYFYIFFINTIIYKIKQITYSLYNREIIKKYFYLIRI